MATEGVLRAQSVSQILSSSIVSSLDFPTLGWRCWDEFQVEASVKGAARENEAGERSVREMQP